MALNWKKDGSTTIAAALGNGLNCRWDADSNVFALSGWMKIGAGAESAITEHRQQLPLHQALVLATALAAAMKSTQAKNHEDADRIAHNAWRAAQNSLPIFGADLAFQAAWRDAPDPGHLSGDFVRNNLNDLFYSLQALHIKDPGITKNLPTRGTELPTWSVGDVNAPGLKASALTFSIRDNRRLCADNESERLELPECESPGGSTLTPKNLHAVKQMILSHKAVQDTPGLAKKLRELEQLAAFETKAFTAILAWRDSALNVKTPSAAASTLLLKHGLTERAAAGVSGAAKQQPFKTVYRTSGSSQ